MVPKPRVAAVLLDIDGTLLDSNDAHASAWRDVFQQYGHDVPFERIRPLIGKGSDKLLPELIGLPEDDPKGEEMSDARTRVFLERYLPGLSPTRGTRALLRRLKEHGLPLVVATSAGGQELQSLLQQAEVEDLVDRATTSDDADRSKPDPDIISAALRKAGVPAERALMLGDTPYDVQAAKAAGVAAIALRCGGWWKDDDLAGALSIYDDPEDLLRGLVNSPVFAEPSFHEA